MQPSQKKWVTHRDGETNAKSPQKKKAALVIEKNENKNSSASPKPQQQHGNCNFPSTIETPTGTASTAIPLTTTLPTTFHMMTKDKKKTNNKNDGRNTKYERENDVYYHQQQMNNNNNGIILAPRVTRTKRALIIHDVENGAPKQPIAGLSHSSHDHWIADLSKKSDTPTRVSKAQKTSEPDNEISQPNSQQPILLPPKHSIPTMTNTNEMRNNIHHNQPKGFAPKSLAAHNKMSNSQDEDDSSATATGINIPGQSQVQQPMFSSSLPIGQPSNPVPGQLSKHSSKLSVEERRERNRESAARSRHKRKEYAEKLEDRVKMLESHLVNMPKLMERVRDYLFFMQEELERADPARARLLSGMMQPLIEELNKTIQLKIIASASINLSTSPAPVHIPISSSGVMPFSSLTNMPMSAPEQANATGVSSVLGAMHVNRHTVPSSEFLPSSMPFLRKMLTNGNNSSTMFPNSQPASSNDRPMLSVNDLHPHLSVDDSKES